ERVVHARIAMRVVLAQHIAHHRRGFLEWTSGHEPELVHRVQHATMHGLESVTHIGERTGDDHAHRVVDERFLHLGIDEARDDAFPVVRSSHEAGVTGGNTSGSQHWKYTLC